MLFLWFAQNACMAGGAEKRFFGEGKSQNLLKKKEKYVKMTTVNHY